MPYRLFFVFLLLTFSATNADAEPPLKGYRGWVTPTEYFGIFYLSESALSESEKSGESITPFLFSDNLTYFRLKGVETTPEALRKYATDFIFYCEEYGTVESSSVGVLHIVECRSENTISLGRLLLEKHVATPICSELYFQSAICSR